MIKRFFLLLISIILLAGCANDSPIIGPSESLETKPVPGRADREIIDDYQNASPEGKHDFSILFMNAGKADCILVSVDSKHYLIDTGTAASVPVILAALEKQGVSSLSGIFITHTDNDHTGGFTAIAEKYPAHVIYTSSISADWNKVDEIRGSIERVPLDPGATVKVADGVYFTVMGPIKYDPNDDNNNSLILRLEVNGVSVIFAGDMMMDEEKTLLSAPFPLDCDILKVAYHGQKEATSVSFLEKTTPDIAVISTDRGEDENSVSKNVVNALKNAGSRIFITDDFSLGCLLTVDHEGNTAVSDLETSQKPKKIKILSASKEDQTTIIQNYESMAVDISGWYIVSVRGREIFKFPEGSVISPNESITVACREYNGEYDYFWPENRVWHKDKKDVAILYDTWGNRVDETKSK